MVTAYKVYGNGGTGGPVDLSAPIATVLTGTAWTPPALARPSDWTFLVRAFDTATGYTELNTVATFRIALDALGNDVTRRPAPPDSVGASARAGGAVRVRWRYSNPPGAAPPTGFRVYLGTAAVDYATVRATVPYFAGLDRYATGPDFALPALGPGPAAAAAADPTGLADGVQYLAAVRAYNAAGEEQNALAAVVVGNVSAPSPVDPVSAVATA